MKYFEYYIYLENYENRFNRTMWIDQTLPSKELTVMILTALGAEFENPFVTEMKNENEFVIKYEDYKFIVKKTRNIENKSQKIALVKKGVGESLWENNYQELIRYMNGEKVNKEDPEEFDEKIDLDFTNTYLEYSFASFMSDLK